MPETERQTEHGGEETARGERQRHRRRRRHTVFFDLVETADDRFDRSIEASLILLLGFAPLALGAVEAWSGLVVLALSAVMALGLAIKLLRRPDVKFVWSWTYLPIAFFLVLTTLQLLSLPAWLVRAFSIHTFELRQSLLSNVPAESDRHLAFFPLSLYPRATMGNLRLLLAISAIYVVSINTIRQSRQVHRLLVAIAAIGVVIALIGFAHLAIGAQHIYGMVGTLPKAWTLGPFMNRNHFGQFMNLSLGAAIALLLTQIDQLLRSRSRALAPDEHALEQVPLIIWAAAVAIMIIGIGVFLSASRGAMVSAVIAGGVVIALARYGGTQARMWLLLPLLWIVALVVIYFGYDVLSARFSEVDTASSQSVGGRLTIVQDTLRAWKQFPIFGIGMGAFQTVYPMFDSSNDVYLASHAENEYVQVLLEGGVLGLGAVLLFLGMIGWSYVRCIRSAPSPMASAAVGLGYSLIAVVLQSFTDFGQHVPANAALSAVLCGMLATLAEASRRTSSTPVPPIADKPRLALAPRLAAGIIVLFIFGAAIVDAMASARAERNWAYARRIEQALAAHEWQGSDDTYRSLIGSAADAARQRPDDIHYQYWLNFYRWKLISRTADPKTGQLLLDEQGLKHADRINQELLSSVWRCPTYGPSYLLAGQIEQNILSKPSGAQLIRTAYMLSQNDPVANYEAALVDARQGQWDAAMRKFQHAANLSAPYLIDGVDALARQLDRPDLALQLADQNVAAVRRVVEILHQKADPRAQDAQKRLNELIKSRAAENNAPVSLLIDAARLSMSEGDYSGAVLLYRRAVNRDYNHLEWRLELANALAEDGKMPEAIDEARIAQRMGLATADSVLSELRTRLKNTPQPVKVEETSVQSPR